MPAEMEAALKRRAAKMGKTGRAADRYVYGTMNKMGIMHGNKRVENAGSESAVSNARRVKRGRNLTPGQPRGSVNTNVASKNSKYIRRIKNKYPYNYPRGTQS